MVIYVKGFRVVVPVKGRRAGMETLKALSRTFVVREAAEAFCTIARREHEGAYVQEVRGYDKDPVGATVR